MVQIHCGSKNCKFAEEEHQQTQIFYPVWQKWSKLSVLSMLRFLLQFLTIKLYKTVLTEIIINKRPFCLFHNSYRSKNNNAEGN